MPLKHSITAPPPVHPLACRLLPAPCFPRRCTKHDSNNTIRHPDKYLPTSPPSTHIPPSPPSTNTPPHLVTILPDSCYLSNTPFHLQNTFTHKPLHPKHSTYTSLHSHTSIHHDLSLTCLFICTFHVPLTPASITARHIIYMRPSAYTFLLSSPQLSPRLLNKTNTKCVGE